MSNLDSLRLKCQDIAWNHPTSDHRDVRNIMRDMMLSYDPTIFKVPADIMRDPRTKLGFGANQAGHRSALIPYMSEPGIVLPGVPSILPEFDVFTYELAKRLTTDHPASVDSDGFAGPNAVTRDFSALLTRTGVKMSAANAPPVSRDILMKDTGIEDHFVSKRHERIFTAVHEMIFRMRKKGAPMSFQVRSSTTMPTHYSGKGSQLQKQMMIHNIGRHLSEIFDLLERGNLESLYKDFQIYFGEKLVERAQAEGAVDFSKGGLTGKDRLVCDMQYALSGGREGRRSPASKTATTRELWGQKYGLGARIRTAYAVSGQINMLIGLFLAGTRAYYLNECEYTWHHTTPDQIYQDIREYEHVIGLDVTTMDQFFPKFLLDFHAQRIATYYDPRFGKLISYVNGIPYYAPQLTKGASPFWVGDPRDPSTFKVDVGLSSGRTDNPDCGKWYMTSAYLCVVDDLTKDVLEQGRNDFESVANCLKGLHPKFGIKDMSDDALIGFKTGYGALGRQLRSIISKAEQDGRSASPYCVLGIEQGISFLGNVILKDETGVIARPKPNPVTFIVNKYCAERGITSPNRLYWAHGMRAAEEHYSRAGSIISDILYMERDLWRHYMKGFPTPEQLINAAIVHQKVPLGSALTAADLEVLLDPSKLHYKFTLDDISVEVARLFTATIDGDVVDSYIEAFI